MLRSGVALLLLLAPSAALAQVRQLPAAPAGNLAEQVAPSHKDLVAKVVNRPTLTARFAEPAFVAPLAVYEWMLDHPDRVSLAWPRMGVACAEITDKGNGRFGWTDEHGSEVTWQPVGKSPGQVIWYASGRVKPAALVPMVPVKAVAVLKYPHTPTEQAGAAKLSPELNVYVLTDSRAANALLRMLGPGAAKAGEQAAEQLLFFFSGVAGHLYRHPDKTKELLGPKTK